MLRTNKCSKTNIWLASIIITGFIALYLFSAFAKESAEVSTSAFSYASYKLIPPSGGDIVDFSVYGDTIYYSVLREPQNETDSKTYEIYSKNTEKDTVALLLKTIDAGIKMNNLKSNEQSLFWVLQDSKKKWTLYRMNLNNHLVEAVYQSKTSPSSIPISVALSNTHLIWYESDDSLSKGHTYALKILDIEANTIESFHDDIHLMSPYDTPYINDSIITYLKRNNSKNSIVTYDLVQNNFVGAYAPESSILSPMSDNKHMIWHDGFGNANVYILKDFKNIIKRDSESSESLTILNDQEIDIFTIHLLEDWILINDRASKSIISYNLDTGKYNDISQESMAASHSSYITNGSITVDDKFIAKQIIDKDIYCIIIAPENNTSKNKASSISN